MSVTKLAVESFHFHQAQELSGIHHGAEKSYVLVGWRNFHNHGAILYIPKDEDVRRRVVIGGRPHGSLLMVVT